MQKWMSAFLFFVVLAGTLFAINTVDASMQRTQTEIKRLTPQPTKTPFPDLGLAPELNNDVWLNAAAPLKLASLRGKVVLLNMWTYGCFNCKRVVPYLNDWHAKYAAQGLVIIGNHFAEFDEERDFNNLKRAVKNLGIYYPVVVDNEGKTWRDYNNYFWPTLYLIDKGGHVRYTRIGEGAYKETEAAIQELLAQTYTP